MSIKALKSDPLQRAFPLCLYFHISKAHCNGQLQHFVMFHFFCYIVY